MEFRDLHAGASIALNSGKIFLKIAVPYSFCISSAILCCASIAEQ